MQSHGITLCFHREMADSARELVRLDGSAAVTLESYPRFIKGGFQDYEGLGIKRSTADSKHVPSIRSRLPGNNVFWSLPQKVVEFLELPGALVSCPTLTRSPSKVMRSVRHSVFWRRRSLDFNPKSARYKIAVRGC